MIEVGCIDPEDVPDDREDATDDHGNDIDDATAIRVGAEVRGAVDYDDDFDYFRFQAERGQSYQIDVAPGTLDDSIVNLFDSDGWFLDTNDDYGDTYASRLYWEAPSSGERYVAVEGYGIGTYTLTVSLIVDDHGNSEGDATAIRVGADVLGALDYDGDIDFFRFQAERGQSYQIDVALGTLDDSIVNLFDSDGWFLDTNDDYEGTYASRLSWYAPSSGERYVAVEGYGIGTYTLTVSLIVDDHGNSEGDATAIRVGADVRGALEYDGDFDFFRFQAEAGRGYQIDVALGTLDNSIVELYDADGSFLDANDDYGITYASRLSWVAPSSGERYVFVGGYGVGTYTLTVSLIVDDHGNSEGDATAIRVGADVLGALDYDGDIDFFRFQAERGQSYQIDVALGTLDDSIVNLFDSDGWFLDTNDDYEGTYASRLSWYAPSSGERYVAVEGYGIGTYTLTVSLIVDDHGNSEGDATAIRVGADVRGALEYDGDFDFFRFQAEAGRGYQIDVALGTLDNSIVELYDADGSFLDANDDYGVTYASRLSWVAPSSGEHYVFVGGYGIGTYTLTVSLIVDDHGNSEGDATAIRVGADVLGALDYDGDIDYFHMIALSGRTYQIDVTLGTLYDSIVKLYDEDGSLLDSNDDYGGTLASRLYWEAHSVKDYRHYISVEGYGIGTYTLTVSIVDDHGNDFESATGIAIGEGVRILLHYYDDRDVLVFRARPGTDYVVTLDWEYYSFRESYTERPLLAVYSANGQEHTRLMGYDFYENGVTSIDLLWQALTGEDYYIVIGDGNTEGAGAFSVTVR